MSNEQMIDEIDRTHFHYSTKNDNIQSNS